MHSVLVLIRTRLNPAQRNKIENEPRHAGATAWETWNSPTDFLLVVPHESAEAADEYLRETVEHGRTLESQGFKGSGTIDVMSIEVHNKAGTQLDEAPIGAFLSVSMRIAEPGLAKELEADVENVFRELDQIDGMLGWLCGSRSNVPEEIVGLAIWRDFDAYESSLPRGLRRSGLAVYRRTL